MFLGTRIIVANQSAVAGNAENQVLFDIEVGEPGMPELIPPNAGPAYDVAAERPLARRSRWSGRVSSRRGRTVVVALSRGMAGTPARVRVTARGRTLASGTLRGRTLRLTLRPGARLPGAVTVRGVRRSGPLRAALLILAGA